MREMGKTFGWCCGRGESHNTLWTLLMWKNRWRSGKAGKVGWGVLVNDSNVTLVEMNIAGGGSEPAEWTVQMKRPSAIRMSSDRDSAPIRAWLVPSRKRDWRRWIAVQEGRETRLPPPMPPSPLPSPLPVPDLVARRRWIGAASTSGFCCSIAFWNYRSCRRRCAPARVTATVNDFPFKESQKRIKGHLEEYPEPTKRFEITFRESSGFFLAPSSLPQ